MGEDAVVAARLKRVPPNLEEHMLQYSCLDPTTLDDPAHPSPAARDVIANAIWRVVKPELAVRESATGG